MLFVLVADVLLLDDSHELENTTKVSRHVESEPFATINATGRVFAVLSLILFFFKIFRFYSISQVLGPRVLMVAKMVIN